MAVRPLEVRDKAAYCALVSDPRVRAYLGGPVNDPAARFAHDVGVRAEGSVFVVTRLAQDDLLGLVSLTLHKEGADVELSYQMSPEIWGQGVAHQGCWLVLDRVAPGLGVKRVIAETQVANVWSVRLLERLGFVAFDEVERFGALQVMMAREISQ